jgi:hypothetical protein
MQNDDRDEMRRNQQPGTDDRANTVLPVTAEVGGEGGSYADPTIQVATFGGQLDQDGGQGGAASASNQAIRGADIAGGGMGSEPDPAQGMRRYPTEDPAAPETVARATKQGSKWRGGIIGAAAGLAGAAVFAGLSRRRR